MVLQYCFCIRWYIYTSGFKFVKHVSLLQDTQSTTLKQSDCPKNSGSVLSLSPSERLEDRPSLCTLNKESTTLFPNKRSRHDDRNSQCSNASGSSQTATKECTTTKRGSPPSIFGFPLVELQGKKECQPKKEVPTSPKGTFAELNGKKESQIKKENSPAPPSATAVELNVLKEGEIKKEASTSPLAAAGVCHPFVCDGNSTLLPSYLNYVIHLEDKVRRMSAERERLKADMMQVQSILNAYKSRIDNSLNKENEDWELASCGWQCIFCHMSNARALFFHQFSCAYSRLYLSQNHQIRTFLLPSNFTVVPVSGFHAPVM